MTKHNAIDWTAVEADYRAGAMSNRQIARKHGASESAVRKKASTEGWEREGAAPVHQPPAVVMARREAEVILPQTPGDDHVDRGKALTLRMLDELDAVTSHLGEIEELIEAETVDDANGQRRAAMMRAVSLPARAQTLKTLAQALGALNAETVEKKGKKEQRADAAAEAARGRFAPPPPPRLVADNTR